eukprot:Gb_16501 [translate_table: standard]
MLLSTCKVAPNSILLAVKGRHGVELRVRSRLIFHTVFGGWCCWVHVCANYKLLSSHATNNKSDAPIVRLEIVSTTLKSPLPLPSLGILANSSFQGHYLLVLYLFQLKDIHLLACLSVRFSSQASFYKKLCSIELARSASPMSELVGAFCIFAAFSDMLTSSGHFHQGLLLQDSVVVPAFRLSKPCLSQLAYVALYQNVFALKSLIVISNLVLIVCT